MKIQLGVALLISVTNLSVCLNSIAWKSSTPEKSSNLPDWSIPSLCEKLNEVYNEEDSFLVLVSIQGSNTKPKIFRKGCFLLQSKRFDGPQNGMIDTNSRYFAPRTYGSIYNNKKMRCAPFIEEQMPEHFRPFNETVVTALEALQICTFFGQSSQHTGEKRFVPKYMPLVLNVESKLRCIHFAFDYDEKDTWIKEVNSGCTQPVHTVKKKPSVVKAMSEATCQFLGPDIECKPVDKLKTRITRLNLLFNARKKEIREGRAEAQINKRNPKASKENEVIDKYIERVALRKRRERVQKLEAEAMKQLNQEQTPPEYEYRCENCRRYKKSKRNGNFKITTDSSPKFKRKSTKSSSVPNKFVRPPTLTIPKQEKKEVVKSSQVNESIRNSNRKSNVHYKNEAKIMAKGFKPR